MSRTVTIVQRRLTEYRVPLFERMRSLLAAQEITLRVMHGRGTSAEASKNDAGKIAWAEPLQTRYFLQDRLCWQPYANTAAGSDLIIVTQENKLLNNLLAISSPLRRYSIAFWGHGRNMQAQRPNGLKERFKRWTTSRVDWWFAYTELSAKFVHDDGFPSDRITVLNNSIDTSTLLAEVKAARATPRPELRARLGLPEEGPLAVFIGSLYLEKRIPWLLQAADAIRQRLPGFNLAIAGDGPQRADVQAAAAAKPYLHYLGGVRGARKAELLGAADVMLNPGLVGLGILDAFVAGLPLLTTNCNLHSPEIAYLTHGHNGLMIADDLAAYVDATVALLQDAEALADLGAGAATSCAQFSIEQMAQRFCAGIQQFFGGSEGPASSATPNILVSPRTRNCSP